MLAIIMSWFWVQSVIEQGLNQKLRVRYFTELNLGLIDNFPVIKADTIF